MKQNVNIVVMDGVPVAGFHVGLTDPVFACETAYHAAALAGLLSDGRDVEAERFCLVLERITVLRRVDPDDLVPADVTVYVNVCDGVMAEIYVNDGASSRYFDPVPYCTELKPAQPWNPAQAAGNVVN